MFAHYVRTLFALSDVSGIDYITGTPGSRHIGKAPPSQRRRGHPHGGPQLPLVATWPIGASICGFKEPIWPIEIRGTNPTSQKVFKSSKNKPTELQKLALGMILGISLESISIKFMIYAYSAITTEMLIFTAFR